MSTGTIICQYIYPNSHSNVFSTNDTVVVAWSSTFSNPILSLSCNTDLDFYSEPQEPGAGAVSLPLNYRLNDGCYFKLLENQNKLLSPVFDIRPQNGTAYTYWSSNVFTSNIMETDKFDANTVASISAAIASKSSMGGTTTTVTDHNPAMRTSDVILTTVAPISTPPVKRPIVTLPGDTAGDVRSPDDDYDCLDNQADFDALCWGALNISQWLPEWVKYTT